MSYITKTGIPLYRQIYDDLLNKILNKEFLEGEKLPTEKQLQEEYQVSRITIRRPMEMLQENGYIKKISGVGTIVISNKHILQLEKISSFSDDNLDHQSLSRLINFDIIEAPTKVASNLNMNENTKVYLIERLRIVDKEIVGFHRVYIPLNLVQLNEEDLSDPQVSLYEIFEKNNIKLATSNETIEAMMADNEIQNLLEIPKNSALLNRKRSLFNDKGKPVEYVEMYYLAEHFKYKVKLEKN